MAVRSQRPSSRLSVGPAVASAKAAGAVGACIDALVNHRAGHEPLTKDSHEAPKDTKCDPN
jgi:hypothetical protein